MDRWAENTLLVGVCYLGEAVWADYQPLCELNETNVEKQLSPFGERRGRRWYGTKSRQRADGQEVLPVAASAPLLSIVIPFHDNGELTCQALYELVLDSSPFKTEVILVDDGSDGIERGRVQQCATVFQKRYGTPIQIHSNEESMGFSFSCNRGAALSSGLLLLFANNDMFVLKGAIAILIETMLEQTGAGMVGPMMVAESGVQEMGGIIYSDGTAANAFRGEATPPTHWHLAHEVDYISAACIMLERETFMHLGGFDKRYGRGYYEDTDLAMAIRQNGLKVILQPLAVVYHDEGGTFGSVSPVKQALMDRNRSIFFQKWRVQLSLHLPPGSSHPWAKARHFRQTRRALWIDQTIPAPTFDSGSQRTVSIHRALVDLGYKVDLHPLATGYDSGWKNAIFDLRFRGFAHSRNVLNEDNEGHCPYDVIFIARPDTAEQVYPKLIRSPCAVAPVIFDSVDLHYLRTARQVLHEFGLSRNVAVEALMNCTMNPSFVSHIEELDLVIPCVDRALSDEPDWSKVPKNKFVREIMKSAGVLTWEYKMAIVARKFIVVSGDEFGHMQALGINEDKLGIISNVYDDALFSKQDASVDGFVKRNGAIFVGSFQHPPNIQAVDSLCLIAEEISKHDHSFVLHVVGSHQAPDWLVEKMSNLPMVQFHGWLPNHELESLYQTVLVAMCPLHVGAGVKGKVAVAYLNQIPVVASGIAAEGYGLIHNESILIANSTAQFAEMYLLLRRSPTTWDSVTRQGLAELKKKVSYQLAKATLEEILGTIISG